MTEKRRKSLKKGRWNAKEKKIKIKKRTKERKKQQPSWVTQEEEEEEEEEELRWKRKIWEKQVKFIIVKTKEN